MVTYTIVLRNDGWQDMASAYFTATFASDMVPIPESISGGASWDPAHSAFIWSGPLAQGQGLTFSYQAGFVGSLPKGRLVSHTVWMGYDNHNIEFDRIVPTWVNLPVFSQSSFGVQPALGEVGSLLTFTLRVPNTGVADGLVTVTNPLPASLDLVPDTLQANSGTTQVEGGVVHWQVPVAVGDTAVLSYTAIITAPPSGLVLRNRATLDDGLGNTLFLEASAKVIGPILLPVILK
jgi:uncharacterized repeat protein (TIGR01451 family)